MYIKPNPQYHPEATSTRREKWARRLQYLYFLRFCLLGWLLLPSVCALDAWTGVSALSRGIMTLSSGWQAFHAAFFVVTFTTTTLVCARNIVMNGNFRFACQPPALLYEWLTACEKRIVWTVLAVAQVPAIFTLWYVARTTISEQVGFEGSDTATWPYGGWHLSLWGWYAGGLVAACTFWYLVTLFYMWTHEWIEGEGPRALIFPPLLKKVEEALQVSSKPKLAEWLEGALRWPLKFTHIGYAWNSDGPLWELHFLTTVSLIAFVLLYLFLYPIVAPVVTTTKPGAEIVFAAVICISVLRGARKTGSWWRMEKPGLFFSFLFLLLFGAFVYFSVSDLQNQTVKLERSFPVLASVTVILIFMQWGINGASFFFDRYRVPVLTSAIALIFLPKLALSYVPPVSGASWIQWVQAHIVDWDADHYFEVRQISQVTAPPSPSDAVNNVVKHLIATGQKDAEDEPLVVITATGGGIQAAEWTAQVMARLEKDFREYPQTQRIGYVLHDHVLLASGVSGGSVGLLPYLAEYTASPATAFPANDNLRNQLTIGPGCSSLEAVAWGLEYYDLQRLALTLRFPMLQSAQDSGEDMKTMVAPDRTWALSRALNRNMNDPECGFSRDTPTVPEAEKITLGQAAMNLRKGTMPAFTLNTTVAETGGRFLLSNYMVPPAKETDPANTEFLPAESFLQAYALDPCCKNGPHGEKLYADLPLSTAARLSATFPVVSSATRIPWQYAKAASHFLDGGYFDNDGTGSAIEFLYSVMNARVDPRSHPPDGSKEAPVAKPLKVLLVEIRDGDDLNPDVAPDDLEHQSGGPPSPAPWWMLNQMLGPLEGLWNAGHVSVTRRNRRELCELETAYEGELLIHHVVFAIPLQTDDKNKKKPAPLSWKLTASQLAWIRSVAIGRESGDTDLVVKDAIKWVADAETSTPSSEVCHVYKALAP